jgi:hypothetical protein
VAVGVGDGVDADVDVGTGVNVGGWDELIIAAPAMTALVAVVGELGIGDASVGENTGVWGNGVEQPARINSNKRRHGDRNKKDPLGSADSRDRKSLVINILATVLTLYWVLCKAFRGRFSVS